MMTIEEFASFRYLHDFLRMPECKRTHNADTLCFVQKNKESAKLELFLQGSPCQACDARNA